MKIKMVFDISWECPNETAQLISPSYENTFFPFVSPPSVNKARPCLASEIRQKPVMFVVAWTETTVLFMASLPGTMSSNIIVITVRSKYWRREIFSDFENPSLHRVVRLLW